MSLDCVLNIWVQCIVHGPTTTFFLMLLVPFCSRRNGRNFLNRIANQNGNTFYSTSVEIPANSDLFRAFQSVSGNFGQYEFWLSFPFWTNLFCLLAGSKLKATLFLLQLGLNSKLEPTISPLVLSLFPKVSRKEISSSIKKKRTSKKILNARLGWDLGIGMWEYWDLVEMGLKRKRKIREYVKKRR